MSIARLVLAELRKTFATLRVTILELFEISQVLMVRDHHDWMFSSCEVMLPFLQGLDDSEEFSIIDVIVLFCGGEGGRMVGTRMEISIRVLLYKYTSRGCKGGIHHDKERFGCVRHFDYWGREECFFESYECVVLFLPPRSEERRVGKEC